MKCPSSQRRVQRWGIAQAVENLPDDVTFPRPQWVDASIDPTSKVLKPIVADPHPVFDWLHSNAKDDWEIVAVIVVPRYRWRPRGENDGRFYHASISAWGIAFASTDDRLLYRMRWL